MQINNSIALNLQVPNNPQAINTMESESEEKDISIGEALKSIVAGISDGFISLVGYTGSTLYHLPKATYELAEGIIKTKAIGPNLKALCLALLPLAVALTPALAAVGSTTYGIVKGFEEALKTDKSIKEILKEEVNNINKFHNEKAKEAIEYLEKLQDLKPDEGEKPVDIRIIETLKALISAVIGMGLDSVGATAITALNLPQLTIKSIKEIIKDTKNKPILRGLQLLLLSLLVPLSLPLSLVGGAAYGLYNGAKEGYQEGILQAISKNFSDLQNYNKFLKEIAK